MSTKSSPSDFSLFSLFTAGLACMVPLASAYTKPVGSSPKGNPISEPGLNSIVPVGAPFSVTWNQNAPDSCPDSTVTLVLLKGPATNAVPQYAIAEKVKNTGTYAWTPSKDLAPGQTGYGIQLICDSNGQYQCKRSSLYSRGCVHLLTHFAQTPLSSASATQTTRLQAASPRPP